MLLEEFFEMLLFDYEFELMFLLYSDFPRISYTLWSLSRANAKIRLRELLYFYENREDKNCFPHGNVC